MEKFLGWWCFCVLGLGTLVWVSQAQDTACLNQLVPCLEYINSNKTPSSSCCNPLKSLIKSDPQCLCSMLGSNSGSQQAGVNMTQAQLLPAKCGQKVSAALCKSSPKTKTSIQNSAGEFLLANAAMVALLSIILHITWGPPILS